MNEHPGREVGHSAGSPGVRHDGVAAWRRLSMFWVLAVGVVVLSGCGLSAEERITVQEEQLQSFIEHADAWGEQITSQVADDEVDLVSDAGGSRGAQEYAQWPRYYYFARTVVLRPEGPRTPTQVADDLEPWLSKQGWERNEEQEFPAYEDSFERYYSRGGYGLTLQVYTEPPPRAQSIDITIVTPTTDPGRSFDE